MTVEIQRYQENRGPKGQYEARNSKQEGSSTEERRLPSTRCLGTLRSLAIACFNRVGEQCRSVLCTARLLDHALFNGLRGLRWSWRSREPKLDVATRHAAYRELWEELEDIYWKLRNGDSDASALRALLRDVNAFLGENLLYIRKADQELFTQYILSLQRLKAAVYPLLDNARRVDGMTAVVWCARTDSASLARSDFVARREGTPPPASTTRAL